MVGTGCDDPVTEAWLGGAAWDVDIAGTRYGVAVSLRPLYDPSSARVRS